MKYLVLVRGIFEKTKNYFLFFSAKTYKILHKNGKNNINKTKNSVVLQIFEKKKNKRL